MTAETDIDALAALVARRGRDGRTVSGRSPAVRQQVSPISGRKKSPRFTRRQSEQLRNYLRLLFGEVRTEKVWAAE